MSDRNERDVEVPITFTMLLHMLKPHLPALLVGAACSFFCAAMFGWCIVLIGLWLGGAIPTIDPIVVPGAALNFVLSVLSAHLTNNRFERALEEIDRR